MKTCIKRILYLGLALVVLIVCGVWMTYTARRSGEDLPWMFQQSEEKACLNDLTSRRAWVYTVNSQMSIDDKTSKGEPYTLTEIYKTKVSRTPELFVSTLLESSASSTLVNQEIKALIAHDETSAGDFRPSYTVYDLDAKTKTTYAYYDVGWMYLKSTLSDDEIAKNGTYAQIWTLDELPHQTAPGQLEAYDSTTHGKYIFYFDTVSHTLKTVDYLSDDLTYRSHYTLLDEQPETSVPQDIIDEAGNFNVESAFSSEDIVPTVSGTVYVPDDI